MAVLNYEAANNKLPVGMVSQAKDVEGWSWSTFTLPYLEQLALYNRLRPSSSYKMPPDGARSGQRNLCDLFIAASSNPSELEPIQTPLSIFRCPSDDTPDLVPYDSLRSALLRLPLRQRSALVLRYFEDLPDAAIAELLRCRPATVRSLVARGLEALRTTPEVIS